MVRLTSLFVTFKFVKFKYFLYFCSIVKHKYNKYEKINRDYTSRSLSIVFEIAEV